MGPIDRSNWPAGPWDNEPDHEAWVDSTTGYPCITHRNDFGVWCGYVAVPPGHPYHGAFYDDLNIRVHGGLSYGGPCSGDICHVPAPGEPDDVYWLSFDCGHIGSGDAMPTRNWGGTYKTLDFVKQQCQHLAAQLKAVTQ